MNGKTRLETDEDKNVSKAILEFSIPEEEEEFHLAANARGAYAVIAELDSYLRDIVKYGSTSYTEEQIAVVENIRKDFRDLRDSYNIDIY